ncbi:hypothetical protein AMTRI_Chr13g118300 [Amborella trichopoda]
MPLWTFSRPRNKCKMTGCPNPGWRRYCLWNGGFWRFWCDVWVEWRRLESSLSEEVTLSGIVGVQVVGDVRTFRGEGCLCIVSLKGVIFGSRKLYFLISSSCNSGAMSMYC